MICSVIVAAAVNEVIGRDGALPWHIPADLRRFRALTSGHVVVLGRATQDSIVARLGRALPGRTSIVVSRARAPAADGVRWAGSVESALAEAAALAREAGQAEFFVAGGARVYAQALPAAGRVYLTRVHAEAAGEVAMPAGWLAGFEVTAREDVAPDGPVPGFSWLTYRRAAA